MYLFKDGKFEIAVAIVLKHEGGLTDNLSDPGGITNYGISLRFLRAAGIDGNMNRSEHITAADIRALNPNKAKSIYYTYFWKKYNINSINSQLICNSLLDMSVLMGGQEAIELLQLSVNKLIESKINVDGILGPETALYINHGNSAQINYAYKEQCRLHMLDITTKNPKLKIFYDGWINRINSL